MEKGIWLSPKALGLWLIMSCELDNASYRHMRVVTDQKYDIRAAVTALETLDVRDIQAEGSRGTSGNFLGGPEDEETRDDEDSIQSREHDDDHGEEPQLDPDDPTVYLITNDLESSGVLEEEQVRELLAQAASSKRGPKGERLSPVSEGPPEGVRRSWVERSRRRI